MNPVIIANWKMQLGIAESATLTGQLLDHCRNKKPAVTVVLSPSFTALSTIGGLLTGPEIKLGAQDVFWQDRGAHTGEVSPLMLQELGVEYAIIGHSERRALGETDTDVARKTLAALAHGIRPIICLGETAEERSRGQQEDVIRRQLEKTFRSAPPPTRNQVVYIAYEPIWAISPHDAADPEEADRMRLFIRRTLIDFFPADLVESSFMVIYGGSVDAENVTDYVGPGKYRGALVGKTSLDAQKFCQLIQNVGRKFTGD